MNILHLGSGSLNDGANRGTVWLHEGLIQIGINSKLYLSHHDKESFGNGIINPVRNIKNKIYIKKVFERIILSPFLKKNSGLFSTGFFGLDLTKLKCYKDADIIHLHWINNNFLSLYDISKIKKPIVWTVRDMWPFTGGCHYSIDCNKYKLKCSKCPKLKRNFNYDLSSFLQKQKQNHFQNNITVVGISNWITKEAASSEIFKNSKCITIHNCIDISIFQPLNKKEAKSRLGILHEKKIILIGSISLNDTYKGFHKFIESLKFLSPEESAIHSFGIMPNDYRKQITNLGFEYSNLGSISDNEILNQIYSSSDVFVAPSIQEAFGKTIAESLSSGTPVVCFNHGGPKDIVNHLQNGYKAKPFSSEDLANGINWVLKTKMSNELSIKARMSMEEKFDKIIIAKQYQELYKEILENFSSLK